MTTSASMLEDSSLLAVAETLLGTRGEAQKLLLGTQQILARSDSRTIVRCDEEVMRLVVRGCMERRRTLALFDPGALEPSSHTAATDSLVLDMLVDLDPLSAADRATYLMHNLFGFTIDEIAARLNRTAPEIRDSIERSHKYLEQCRERRSLDYCHDQRISATDSSARRSDNVDET